MAPDAVDLEMGTFSKAIPSVGDLLASQAAIAPIVCGSDELATRLMLDCVGRGIFLQAILPPVVPVGSLRLGAIVTANRSVEEFDDAVDVLASGAHVLGILRSHRRQTAAPRCACAGVASGTAR